MTPFSILKHATKAEPAVKVALGATGLAAAAAIVQSFSLGWPVAVFGSLIVLIFMFLVLLFSHLRTSRSESLHRPAMFLTWCFSVLSVATATMLCLSAFFNWPAPLRPLWAPVMQSMQHADSQSVKVRAARLINGVTPGTYALELDVENLSMLPVLASELILVGRQDWGTRCSDDGDRHNPWQKIDIFWPAIFERRGQGAQVWTDLDGHLVTGIANFKAADCGDYLHRVSISVPVQVNLDGHSMTRMCFEVREKGYGERRLRGGAEGKKEVGLPESLMGWGELWVSVRGVGVETEGVRVGR